MYCHHAADFAGSDIEYGVPMRCGKPVDIDSESTCTGFSSSSRSSSFEHVPSTPVAMSRVLPPPFWTAAGARSYFRAPLGPLGVGPGDVLCVRSSARNSLNIGAVGGFLGHVLVLLSEPRVIHRASEEADDLREVLPSGDIWPLLRARSMESTRGDSGLHQSDVFFHLTETGRVVMVGELSDDGEWVPYLENSTDIWVAPPELRAGFQANLLVEVVKDMQAVEGDWSLSTAVRAIFRSADVSDHPNSRAVLQDLKECWQQKPICTSIVIAFWQRYLVKLAEHSPVLVDPAALVLQWMPLKADRALPNELISTMTRCGWNQFQKVPLVPMALSWL